MATEYLPDDALTDDLRGVTRFFGGANRGTCVQITTKEKSHDAPVDVLGLAYVTMTQADAEMLIDCLMNAFEPKKEQTFTRSEVATLLRAQRSTEGCGCCSYRTSAEDTLRDMTSQFAAEAGSDPVDAALAVLEEKGFAPTED